MEARAYEAHLDERKKAFGWRAHMLFLKNAFVLFDIACFFLDWLAGLAVLCGDSEEDGDSEGDEAVLCLSAP